MSQAVYVLGSQSFDPMWEEARADAWRTDTYGCLTSLEKPAQLAS